MSRVELNFVATGNFSQLKVQLDQVRKNVEQINKASMGVGMNSDQIGRMKSMVAQYDKIVQSSGAFHRSVVQTQGVTERFGQSLQNQTMKLGQYFQAIKTNSDKTGGSLRLLADQQVRLSQSMMRSDPFNQGRVFVDTPRKINAITNATAIATKQQQLYNLTLRNGANELINGGKNTQWAGRQLSVGLTLPIVMFGKQASEVFIQFDKELVRMQKVYGTGLIAASDTVVKGIRADVSKLATELAGAYGQSITNTAGMAADLAATGLEGNKLLDATREASRLSILGEVDRQAAVRTTVSLQNVFKLSTKELTESFDYFIAVSNQSSLSLLDLTDAIPRAAPVIDELGGSYKDLAAMMAAMVEAGIPASEAANAIKSSLASLINPTEQTRKSLKGFGIDLVGIVDKTGGKPVETFKLLATEMGRLDELSRARAIEQIFGKFQFARIAALLDNINTKGTQTARVFELMGASSGTLANLAASNMKRVTESTSQKYTIAMESLSAALVPIGEKFTEVFTILMELFTKIFTFINDKGLVNVFVGLGLGIAAVGPIIMTAGTLFGNFFGFLGKAAATIKNLVNGFRTFGQIATAETLAASNAAELFSEKMVQEAASIDVVKAALQKLNTELMHLIVNQTRSAGISMAPAAAVQAQAAAQAAAASSAGRIGSGYLGSTSGQVGSTVSQNIINSKGIGSQFAHAVPKGELTARGLTVAQSMNPGTGVYTTGAAASLQQAMQKTHRMVTLLMTESQAEMQRATIFAEQAGISLAQAEEMIAKDPATFRNLYPSVTILKSTMVRYSTMLEFVDKKLQTATESERRRIEYASREIQHGMETGEGARIAKGTDILLSIATQTAGGARQFDAAMNRLVADLVAKGDITDAVIALATRNSQFTTSPTGALRPLTIQHGKGVRAGASGGQAAAYLGGKDMLTDPSEMSRTTQLKQERDRQIDLIKQNNIAQREAGRALGINTSEIKENNAALSRANAKLQALDLSRGELTIKTEEEIAKMTANSMGLSKNTQVLEAATAFGKTYVLAQEEEIQTLYRLDESGKAIVIQNQEQMIINEQGQEVSASINKNRLMALQAEKALDGQIKLLTENSAVLAANEQELTLNLDQLSASSQAAAAGMAANKEELQAAGRMLTAAFNQQGLASEDRVRLMRNLDRAELESTEKVIMYKDREGNSILSLINSEQGLIASYDIATGKMVKANATNDLETMARQRLTQAYQSEIAQEQQLLGKKRRELAYLDVQAIVFDKNSAQGQRIQSSQEALRTAIDGHTKKILELTTQEALLEKARQREVMSSTARVRAEALRGIEGKLSEDQLSLSKVQRSQILRGLTTQEMLSVEGVVASQNRLGQQTIFLTDQVGKTVIAYVADESGAMRRAGAPPVPTGPVPVGGGVGRTFKMPKGAGMGAMGIGMAASMAGGAMGNSALMYGGMALSMVPMLAAMSGPLIVALAGIAAIGFAIFKLIEYMNNFNEKMTAIGTAAAASEVALNHFGKETYTLVDATTKLTDGTAKAAEEVDVLAKSYADAGDEVTKGFLKQISEADPEQASKMLVDRYMANIVSGLTEEQSKLDIAAILKQTKRIDLTTNINLIIDKIDIKDPSKMLGFQLRGIMDDIKKETSDVTSEFIYSSLSNSTGSLGGEAASFLTNFIGSSGFQGTLDNWLVTNIIGSDSMTSGIGSGLIKYLKGVGKEVVDLQAQYVRLGSALGNAFNTMPIDQLDLALAATFPTIAEFNLMTDEQKALHETAFDEMIKKVQELNPEYAAAMLQARASGASMEAVTRAGALAIRGMITSVEDFKKATEDPVYLNFIIRKYTEEESFKTITEDAAQYLNTGTASSTETATNEPDPVATLQAQFAQEDKRKSEDDAITSKYNKLAEAQDKVIERINKERDARRKLREEQQANNDFMLTEMGLKKQINEALASGDLAGAAMLQQQLANEQDKKDADDRENRLSAAEDKKIKAAEREKNSIEKRRAAEVKALEATRKAEDRAKQLSDARKQAADKEAAAATAAGEAQSDAGVVFDRVLGQIRDKFGVVYFSTPEAAMNDSLIAKLRQQLVDMGVPATTADGYIKTLWETSSSGTLDSKKFDALVTSLKGVTDAATLATIILDAQNRVSEDPTTTMAAAVRAAVMENMGFKPDMLANPALDKIVSDILKTVTKPPVVQSGPHATGGPISGPGGPRDDRIPAMLSNGEYVIQADSVGHYGTGFFDAVNAKKFAGGGAVGGRQDVEQGIRTNSYRSPTGSIRSYSGALNRANSEVENPSQSWNHLCQSLARTIAGAGPFGESALKAWNSIPKKNKHSGTPPGGAIAYYGYSEPGHAVWVNGKGRDGKTYVTSSPWPGLIDPTEVGRVPYNSFSGYGYRGWIDSTPSGRLPINTGTQPPTPRTTPRPRATQPPTPSRTPNPTPSAARRAGVIPFSAVTGTFMGASDFSPMARNITSGFNMGGMAMPKYHSGGRVAYAKGGEVAALLQSGETVLTGQLTDKLTPLLESIANGKMGMGDITNNIVINGANKSPEQIADLVVQKINSTISRQTRNNRVM